MTIPQIPTIPPEGVVVKKLTLFAALVPLLGLFGGILVFCVRLYQTPDAVTRIEDRQAKFETETTAQITQLGKNQDEQASDLKETKAEVHQIFIHAMYGEEHYTTNQPMSR